MAMSGDEAIDWFVPVHTRPDSTTRLFVVPHVGAGPSAAAELGDALPPDIEVWALNLPGRQARHAEPLRTDIAVLAEELAQWLTSNGGKSYSLFGYCSGALLAYRLAGQSSPERLFVASCAAPDIALFPRRLHLLPRERFWELVLEGGGTEPELTEHAELREIFEPTLRADFELYAGYQHQPCRLDLPITVFYGRDDSLRLGALLGWRRHSTFPIDLVELPGEHWLLDEARAELAAELASAMPR